MDRAVERYRRDAFTLVELLVSAAVVALLLLILLAISNQVTSLWSYTAGRIEQFRHSREAFDRISYRLSRATLNTYWDYDNPSTPTRYVRQSELRFLSGPMEPLTGSAPASSRRPSHGIFFQSPLGTVQPGSITMAGLNGLLNTWGYFIEYGSDESFRPDVLNGTAMQPIPRFRLCELIQPADAFSLYSRTSGTNSDGTARTSTYTGKEWFMDSVNTSGSTRPVHVLAENVIALIVLPKLSTQADPSGYRLTPDYVYDSTSVQSEPTINPKNQLPPQVQLTLVAIDEASAKRMGTGSAMPDLGMDGLFLTASRYADDLKALEKTLSDKGLSYRIFSTTIPLREARWSSEQAN